MTTTVIVLLVEDKLPYLEQPIPAMPIPSAGQVLPPDVFNTHTTWVKASKEIVGLMLMTMEPDIQKNLEQLGAYDMLKELKTFYIDNLERLGHAMPQNLAVSLIFVSLRKEYDSFVQNYNMHSIGKMVTELHVMLKLHEQTLPKKETAPALHAIRAGKGLRGSRKLKPGALSLYVVIMEYLVNISKRRVFWSLNEDILKITILKTNTPYPSRKIRCIRACTHQRPQRKQAQYTSIEEVTTDKGKKSNMETFVPNDKADYYSGITSITVNGKNAYELKGKFLDDLHNNAFSGTNEKDGVEQIEYYLKIIDPIKLPNIDHDKLRVVIFPISLARDYWKMGGDEFEVSDDESSDLEEYCIDPDLITKDIVGFKTYEDYKDDWIYEWNENVPWVYDKPWLDNGIWKEPKPVEHTYEPFNYKTGCSEWPTCSWREDGYCNGGNFPGAYHIGNSLHYQDLEWYGALEDSELKDKALRNKAIMEGLISDDESSNDCWKRWKIHEIYYHNYDEGEYKNKTH
ncbi:hypothetical protein Tco_0011240 [Tanacetum coccineum]